MFWIRKSFSFIALAGTALGLPFSGSIIGRDAALLTSYDFIVVGGGTSGLVIGNRLSENPATNVLIIEAGDLDQGEDSIYIPLFATLYSGAAGTKYDWNLTYTPDAYVNNRSIAITQGKVVGGGSCLNRMVFDRAGKIDYDRWKELGDDNPGWDELLPYFKKFEKFTPPTTEVAKDWGIRYDPSAHGYNGSVHSSYPEFYWPSTKYFFSALKQLGIRMVYDSLNGDANGALWNPQSLDPVTKTRSNSRTAYWNPASNRTNLHLLTGNQVTKLLTETNGTRVFIAGVEYAATSNSSRATVAAKKEVILAAGAIHSPQLLQLSGIGTPTLLDSFAIKTIVDLPGVGANFQDHPLLGTNFALNIALNQNNLTTNATFNAEMLALYRLNRTGPFSTEGSDSFAFLPTLNFTNTTTQLVSSASSVTPVSYLAPDIDPTLLTGYEAQYKILLQDLPSPDMPIVEFIWGDGGIYPILQHPFSRGTVKLASTDPFVLPAASPGFLSHPTDLLLLSAGAEFSRKIINTSAFVALSPAETVPGASIQSAADFQAWTRANVGTTYHPSGSTSMMRKEYGGVVDTNYRVYGVENLRVVDAGTFPMIQSAHLQVTVYAMAERAADAIKKTHNL